MFHLISTYFCNVLPQPHADLTQFEVANIKSGYTWPASVTPYSVTSAIG